MCGGGGKPRVRSSSPPKADKSLAQFQAQAAEQTRALTEALQRQTAEANARIAQQQAAFEAERAAAAAAARMQGAYSASSSTAPAPADAKTTAAQAPRKRRAGLDLSIGTAPGAGLNIGK